MRSVHMHIIYCSNVICVSHTARSGKILKIENSTRISRSRLFLGRLVRGFMLALRMDQARLTAIVSSKKSQTYNRVGGHLSWG
jgi:hypothetical protein